MAEVQSVREEEGERERERCVPFVVSSVLEPYQIKIGKAKQSERTRRKKNEEKKKAQHIANVTA